MKHIAYDTETSGLHRHKGARMFTFSECDWNGNTDVKRLPYAEVKVDDDAEARLRWLWSDKNKTSVAKVMHNARFDIGMTEKHLSLRDRPKDLRGHKIHETMALSHLFQNMHPTHSLDALGWELFGYPRGRDDLTKKYLTEERGLLDTPPWILDPYQRADAERTMLIFRLFSPKLDEYGFRDEYEVEQRLIWTTLAIEDRGIMIDRKRCRKMIDEYYHKEEKALQDFYDFTGDHHKPTDSILRHILYRNLKLPVLKKTKKARLPSVDADTIKALAEQTNHPIFDIILRHRAYRHGVSSMEGYLEFADDDGIIHPSIHPYAADTGRASCKNPNLFNVQKDTTLKTAYPIRARRAFRPRPDFVNFHLDYSGIQVRLAVNASRDEALIAMLREDGDMHAAVAALFYRELWARAQSDPVLRKALRDAAKNGNFSIIFGAAPPALAKTLELPLETVIPRYAEYKERFPGLASLYKRLTQEGRENGYVTTTFGRRLYVPKDYAATNYFIQGDEACVMKRAQNRVDQYLRDATGGEAGILLPIYDELIIEWPRDHLADAPGCLREIKRLMEDFPEFDVPMQVDCKISTADWSRTQDYKIAG